MSQTAWKLSIEGPVARMTLARPEIANAIDDAAIAEGARHMEDLASREGVRVVVLAGEGRHFCAGADIRWMRRTRIYTPDENVADALALSRFLERIHACPRPVIARVHGSALGAGCGITAAADVSIAADTSTFGFTEVRLGIIPAVISPFVLRRLTPGAAQGRFLTGRRFDAAEALRIGLVDRVVEEADLDAAVREVVLDMLEGGDGAHRAIKDLVRSVAGRPPAEVQEHTARTLARIRAGDEATEGLTAFLDKRKPSWRD